MANSSNPQPWYVRDIELSEAQADALLDAMAATDAQNAEIGVTGPEVAEYNLREARLQLAERRLVDATVECCRLQRDHEEHPVTVRIAAWRKARVR